MKEHTYRVSFDITLTEQEIKTMSNEDIVKRAIVGKSPKLATIKEI